VSKFFPVFDLPDGHRHVHLRDKEPKHNHIRINEPVPVCLQNNYGIPRLDIHHFIPPNPDEKRNELAASVSSSA
jgi:hypothetical protein